MWAWFWRSIKKLYTVTGDLFARNFINWIRAYGVICRLSVTARRYLHRMPSLSCHDIHCWYISLKFLCKPSWLGWVHKLVGWIGLGEKMNQRPSLIYSTAFDIFKKLHLFFSETWVPYWTRVGLHVTGIETRPDRFFPGRTVFLLAIGFVLVFSSRLSAVD